MGTTLERWRSQEHDRRSLGESSTTISFAGLDVRPYPHQQRMLDALMIERDRHDRHRNLVVAATGTGKTVVAALDYRQLLERQRGRSVAAVRRPSRRDPAGSRSRPTGLCCGAATSARFSRGGRAARGHHVFAMIQSLQGADRRDSARTPSMSWWWTSSTMLLPTATTGSSTIFGRSNCSASRRLPNGSTGGTSPEWFDNRIAVELRLVGSHRPGLPRSVPVLRRG